MTSHQILKTISLLLLTCGLAYADNQVITLKDGSQLKGELVSVAAGVYTLKTPLMGEVHVNTDQVVSITAEGAAPSIPTAAPGSNPIGTTPSIPSAMGMPMPGAGSSGMDQQIASAQQQLMANPDIMSDIQSFAQDPEIAQLISDPALMQQIMSKDVNAIQSNPKGQALMNNPKMRALIEKIQGGSGSSQ